MARVRKKARTVQKPSTEEEPIESQPKKRKTNNKAERSRSRSPMSASIQSVNRLGLKFFENKSCIELAKALLGQILCRKMDSGPVLRGRIVETEAYLGGEDKGSNTFGGRRTEANEPMYMSAGTCFVYMTYGMYHCINFSAHEEGAGVLLRAVEPLEGVDHMQTLRARSRKGDNKKNGKPFKLKDLTSGPSKLCMAFDIDKKSMNKVDVTDSPLIWLEGADSVADKDIVVAKRIGITRAGEWNDKPLRFFVRDCPFVSQF